MTPRRQGRRTTGRMRGVAYWVTDAQLLTWSAVPPERKLAWLEEVNRLTRVAVVGPIARLREAWRQGCL